MHLAAVFVVEAHLTELRAEARRNQFQPRERHALRTFVDMVLESLRSFSEPATPALAAYPYAD